MAAPPWALPASAFPCRKSGAPRQPAATVRKSSSASGRRTSAKRPVADRRCRSPRGSSSSSRSATRSSSTGGSATTCWWPRPIRTAAPRWVWTSRSSSRPTRSTCSTPRPSRGSPLPSLGDLMKAKLLPILFLAISLFAPALVLAQKEIVVWHAYRGDEKTAFEKVVGQFNQSHPNIKVSSLAVPYDAFADKITAAVPRGKGPDIFIYAQDRLGGWIAAGNTVEPLDFFLDAPIKNRFLGTTMQAMTYQGNVYGLPLNFKVITMIYNKKLLPAPPKTTAEMITTGKKLTNAAAGKFGLAYAYTDFYYH